MAFLIGFLTLVMVLDCVIVVLLVLIQLPKKDAGAGIAFGGGATDALFGAGSGNALTKITKYAAGVFLGLSLLLSYMRAHDSGENLEEKLRKKAASAPLVTPSATNTVASTTAVPVLLLSPTNAVATNPPDGSAK